MISELNPVRVSIQQGMIVEQTLLGRSACWVGELHRGLRKNEKVACAMGARDIIKPKPIDEPESYVAIPIDRNHEPFSAKVLTRFNAGRYLSLIQLKQKNRLHLEIPFVSLFPQCATRKFLRNRLTESPNER